VACENIRSAFNVGSVFRTAECFGFEAAWLTGYTVTPESEQLQSTAMGTAETLPWQHFATASDAIKEARKKGYSTIALETGDDAIPAETFDWPERFVLFLGNERFGLDSETRSKVDHCVRLPSHGIKNSLNVGVAFGAACMSIEQSLAKPGFHAIGTARTELVNKQVAPRQGAYGSEVARIELFSKWKGKPSLFDQALKDLEGFERIWILFEFDQTDHFKPMVTPPRSDGEKRGLFATRSPHRPNRIGLTSARLVGAKGFAIEIAEHDLLDGTPILDIKPYVPEADAFPDAKAGWLTTALDSRFRLEESELFKTQIAWLEDEGEARLRPFAREQLEFDPMNHDRKRVRRLSDQLWEIAFRTWRLRFQLNLESRVITLDSIHSGYGISELENIENPYGDKAIHRAFNRRFAR
jgi:tRNA-Thr(GGU) m(6)t(6)A37 methyltransferase TsaA